MVSISGHFNDGQRSSFDPTPIPIKQIEMIVPFEKEIIDSKQK